MRRILPAIAAAALIGLASPAFAFTQEPVSVGGARGSGSGLADPSDQYRTQGQPDSTTPQRQQPSPFSINGPTGPRLSAPVERQGPDNDHLFWNNSSRYWR